MMCIEVNDLLVYAYHGVGEQEAVVGNEFAVSVSLEYDFTEAMLSDDLSGTISYADVIDVIEDVMSVRSLLIEHVAGRLKVALMERWPGISGGMVRVCKLCPPVGRRLGSACCCITF